MVTTNLQERYQKEREKRINAKGLGQYLDNSSSTLYALDIDPWVDANIPIQTPISDGGHCKIVIFGAGFGGLCAAARCLESGAAASPDDILVVDPAGGFGGTWWWNRFPGLMCDIESYVYLPLLERTGYMPKRKYASGKEIREYAELLADHYGVRNRGMFQSFGKTLTWEKDHWKCNILRKLKGKSEQYVNINADYVILASGTFTYPKLPNLPGLESFQGQMLHTARWAHEITGGSEAEPALSGLSGKKVAVIGTGATAIQVVPGVAKYAGETFVFQRTPSSVDFRGNRDTDPEEWKNKIAAKKGWQVERAENFQAFTENVEENPTVDMVHDGWTLMPTISGAYGGPAKYKVEDVEKFVEDMQKQDVERSERVRQRAVDIVKDPEKAKNLQAWYPGWCKRPCFHDEYLPAFNQSNVHLIDTDGKGVEAISPKGVVVAGMEYPIDIIIWCTGYGNPLLESLAGKAEMNVIGTDGKEMEQSFKQGEWSSLHGITAYGYPNMFSLGLAQAGVGVNQTQRLDDQSIYTAYTIREAEQRIGSARCIIEPEKDACEKWGDYIAANAYMLATIGGCTPSYFTAEGEIERQTPEQQAKSARGAIFGQGYTMYSRIIQNWQKAGNLEGLQVMSSS